ncbi:MAG: Mur ligase family protein, partial [Usitatibacteraceae bacterium]
EGEATAEPNPCFAESRRLTGHNRFFAGTGVVLDALGPTADDPAAHARWRHLVTAMRAALGWSGQPGDSAVVRCHASGTLLAFTAPADFLFTATEINEWAWEQASGIFGGVAESEQSGNFDQLHPLGDDFAGVVSVFSKRAALEKNPALAALRRAASEHGVPIFVDDELVSLGAGSGSKTWPLNALPDAGAVHWPALRDVPTALVTGSNGKTTTVRVLAAMLDAGDRPHSGHIGYSSTEGVMIGNEVIGEGDFSGPAGARLVLRDLRVEAAVLETARGGILRRGLAVERAGVAIVTNISADHFGEYGIDSIDDLADVKLVVARALGTQGTLVLNADDPVLLSRAAQQTCRVALFAQDDALPALVALRNAGGSTCGVADQQLWLTHRGARRSLGYVRDMPLTLGGAAAFNIANISAAALAAIALGIPPASIVGVLTQFGSSHRDNPGRLERWTLADITVLIDYAHNPNGLSMLLTTSQSVLRGRATSARPRLGLVLGQAGNRTDGAIADIASAAASFAPDLIVLKEIPAMLRGRAFGEVPALLRDALLAAGYPEEQIRFEPDEVAAARHLLGWARAGDVLVLPIHQSASRKALAGLLDVLGANRWIAGSPLP